MRRFLIVLVVVIVSISVTTPAFAFFARNLQIGSTGEDVRLLQIFLNSDLSTRVADSGPGAPGGETTYFGLKTAQAVARFQELHRDTVLNPLGLTAGTGVVGPLTLNLLNQLSGGGQSVSFSIPTLTIPTPSNIPAIVVPPPPPPLEDTAKKTTPASNLATVPVNGLSNDGSSRTVSLQKISPTKGGTGTKITITGSGFSKSDSGNVVYIAGQRKTGVKSSDGKTMQVTIENPLEQKGQSKITDSIEDNKGNSASISNGTIHISSTDYGDKELDISSLPTDQSDFKLPVGIYVEDVSGAASNGLLFNLQL